MTLERTGGEGHGRGAGRVYGHAGAWMACRGFGWFPRRGSRLAVGWRTWGLFAQSAGMGVQHHTPRPVGSSARYRARTPREVILRGHTDIMLWARLWARLTVARALFPANEKIIYASF